LLIYNYQEKNKHGTKYNGFLFLLFVQSVLTIADKKGIIYYVLFFSNVKIKCFRLADLQLYAETRRITR